LANWIAEQTGASVGYLTEAANSVGAQWVDALPRNGGLNAAQMLSGGMKAVVLLNVEPALDFADASAALKALSAAEMVVALTPFKSAANQWADVILPIAPFTETSGTFVNAEARVQSFYGVVKPLGDTRPGWKVLRVLGNMLGLADFDFDTSEQVREAALGDPVNFPDRLSNQALNAVQLVAVQPRSLDQLERLTDVSIYATDSMVRRATSLQLTADARAVVATVSTSVWNALGLVEGASVRVKQNSSAVVLPVECDPSLAPQAVRIPTGQEATSKLGPMFGPITVEKV
jgi:NADH-quinone oxidoreductase subunit G